MPDGESIYHHIALTALITLHGVDSDVVEFFYAITVDGLPYCGYLIAVRYYYSQRLPDGETAFTQSVGCDSYARNDVGLEGVYLGTSMNATRLVSNRVSYGELSPSVVPGNSHSWCGNGTGCNFPE